MGSVIGSVFGGSDAGSQAAAMHSAGAQGGIDFLKHQLEKAQNRLDPFFRHGRNQLGALIQGTTAEGLDARLGRLFDTDIFRNLVDERTRAVEGQLAAGGLTRSGTALEEIARVPTDLGMALEEMLTGRSRALATAGQNAALGIGNAGASFGGAIANLLRDQGEALASGHLADEQSDAAGKQQLFNTAATAALMFFSDPALKNNVEQVGQIHDLKLYQWDWKPEFEGTAVMVCGTVGFLADEVAEKYPQHVAEFGGFQIIDYPSLLDALEAKH